MNELKEQYSKMYRFASHLYYKYIVGDVGFASWDMERFMGAIETDMEIYPPVGIVTLNMADKIINRHNKFLKFVYNRIVKATSKNFEG